MPGALRALGAKAIRVSLIVKSNLPNAFEHLDRQIDAFREEVPELRVLLVLTSEALPGATQPQLTEKYVAQFAERAAIVAISTSIWPMAQISS